VRSRTPVEGWEMRLGQYLPDGYEWDHDFVPIQEGDLWGRPDGTAQFRTRMAIPAELDGQAVHLEFLTGAEVIVYRDGKPLDGIDPNRTSMLLAPQAQGGETMDLLFEAYTRSVPDDMRNPLTRAFRGCVQHFRSPALLTVDEDALALKYDLEVLTSMAFGASVDEDLATYHLKRLEHVLTLFPLYDCPTDELMEAVPAIREYLRDELFGADSPYGPRDWSELRSASSDAFPPWARMVACHLSWAERFNTLRSPFLTLSSNADE